MNGPTTDADGYIQSHTFLTGARGLDTVRCLEASTPWNGLVFLLRHLKEVGCRYISLSDSLSKGRKLALLRFDCLT